jgi:hypothetical protein
MRNPSKIKGDAEEKYLSLQKVATYGNGFHSDQASCPTLQ